MDKLDDERGPGPTHLWMPSDDLDPPRRLFMLIWAAILGGVGIAGAVWGITRAINGSPALIITVLGFVFLAMGVMSFLGRFVQTPA